MVLMADHQTSRLYTPSQASNAPVGASYCLQNFTSPLENSRLKNKLNLYKGKLHNVRAAPYPQATPSDIQRPPHAQNGTDHASLYATSFKTEQNLLNMSQTRKKKNG